MNLTNASIEDSFDRARMHAAQGQLVVVREDGQCLILPAAATASMNPEMVAAIEQMIPSTSKRKVAVIGDTAWAADAAPNLQAANRAIPFFGLLMGFASIGHSVWVFQGSANVLDAGCRGADVLIVDSASVAKLPNDWQLKAKGVMRNPQILIHDRVSYQLRSPAND